MNMNLLLIGAGGAAQNSYTPIIQLIRNKASQVLLYDGDSFERKNISRQALALGGLGKNKAEVMSSYLKGTTGIEVTPMPQYYFHGCRDLSYWEKTDAIIVMADNHRARREARDTADEIGCWLVSCACESTSGEAWAYHRDNKGGPLDPFHIWKEMETENGNDPIRAGGCTGEEALDQFPQTPYGNMMSAAMAVYLFNNNVLNAEHNSKMRPLIASFTSTTLSTQRLYDTTHVD